MPNSTLKLYYSIFFIVVDNFLLRFIFFLWVSSPEPLSGWRRGDGARPHGAMAVAVAVAG